MVDSIMDFPKVRIKHMIIKDKLLGHTLYEIRILLDEKSEPIIINKRFSDFVNLYEALDCNLEQTQHVIPIHPKKCLNKKILISLGYKDVEFDGQRQMSLILFQKKILSHWKLKDYSLVKKFLSKNEEINPISQKNHLDIALENENSLTNTKEYSVSSNIKEQIENAKNFLVDTFTQNYQAKDFLFLSYQNSFQFKKERLSDLIENLDSQVDYHLRQMNIYKDLSDLKKLVINVRNEKPQKNTNQGNSLEFHEKIIKSLRKQVFMYNELLLDVDSCLNAINRLRKSYKTLEDKSEICSKFNVKNDHNYDSIKEDYYNCRVELKTKEKIMQQELDIMNKNIVSNLNNCCAFFEKN